VPPRPTDAEVVEPAVRVELTAPLMLRQANARGQRQLVRRPRFDDLLRASLRIVGTLYRLYDQPLDADFVGLKALAEQVPTRQTHFVDFRQDHDSNRSGRRQYQGIVGHGVYGPVPRCLLRWLEWGGLLHTAGERVSGAGSWRVVSVAEPGEARNEEE
jgi:hypothetical protein